MFGFKHGVERLGKGVCCGILMWASLGLQAGAGTTISERNTSLNAVTMESALQMAIAAFQQADYPAALAAFDALEATFGEEREYAPLLPTILPVWAYSALQGGDAGRAVELFEQFLEKHPEQTRWRGFAFFSLAQAYQQTGDIDEAIDAYQRFIIDQPGSPEAVISALRQAQLYFDNGQEQEGIDRLLGFAASPQVPATLQAQAQLRALEKALELEEYDQAADILLSRDWAVTEMPELAVLTFSALRLGDYLMSARRLPEALRAYRLVSPQSTLRKAQEGQLARVRFRQARREEAARSGQPEQTLWRDYFSKLIARMEAQLKALEEGEDYTAAYQIRLGEVYLRLARPREAMAIFAYLAEDDALDEALRARAHYRWVLSANALEDWKESLRLARIFMERYPDDPQAPRALYLIANAHQELREYLLAVDVLSDLIAAYPEHALLPRWYFARGLNFTFADDFQAARDDFARYLRDYADKPQVHQARLWHGLTWFFQRDYPKALEELNAALELTPSSHPVYPEIQYRRGNTLYSMRDYEAALVAIENFVASYPGHARVPEARVLKGDVLMGQGRLLEASNQFYAIGPEAGPLFVYAVFQRGKILRALEEYERMVEHFKEFVQREDVPEKTRVAEALYWIGWAYTRMEQQAEAFPFFVQAIMDYGNDPTAGETTGMLQALDKLHRQYQQGDLALPEVAEPRVIALLEAERLRGWLESEAERAETNAQWTWFSRIQLYLAMEARRRKDLDDENLALLSIVEKVPLRLLDAEGLAAAGEKLRSEGFPSARDYFEFLLETFPRSFHQGDAYYGLAAIAAQEQDWDRASIMLADFQAETPLHPLAHQAALLRGEVLTARGEYAQADAVYEDLLKLRSARGRPHAQAILGLARSHEAAGEIKPAIAYYQRLYTVYRAYPELLAEAYVRSAELFAQLDDLPSALRTVLEMLKDERLRRVEASWAQAEALRQEWMPLVPAEALEPPEELDAEAPGTADAPAATTEELAP